MSMSGSENAVPPQPPQPPQPPPNTFARLYARELQITQPSDVDILIQQVAVGPSAEPRVVRAPRELLGVALSGGGIRSATFALGLLQRLHRFGLLQHVDYLSTVSGGGYIGSWWTAWRHRYGDRPADGNEPATGPFPTLPSSASGDVEPPAVRHLREFSNFLIPRMGFLKVETWYAIVGAIGSLLPALAIAAAVILCVELAGRFVAWASAASPASGVAVSFLIAITVLVVMEQWRVAELPSGGTPDRSIRSNWKSSYCFFALGGLLACVAVHWGLVTYWLPAPEASPQVVALADIRGTFTPWWKTEATSWRMEAWPFIGPLACVGATGLGFVLRLGLLVLQQYGCRAADDYLRSLDRVIMRFLGIALVQFSLAGIWEVGRFLSEGGYSLLLGLLTAGGSTSVFTYLARFLPQGGATSRSGTLSTLVRPHLMMLAAHIAVAAIAALLVSLLYALGCQTQGPACWVFCGAAVVLAVSLLLPPEEFGLHDLYRQRLARAYIGASRMPAGRSAATNRETEFDPEQDDIRLRQLFPAGQPAGAARRHVHLICCAANDLAGDHLANLSRGARSAVVSPLGISLGNAWDDPGDLRMSSALTASAAAFNSQMGALSIRLGPAVAFLLSALNLRLGRWVKHPRSPASGWDWFPGRWRFREMFDLTQAGGECPRVHLSDGGHFENLALYELVRRHCRCIIVSDAGCDPNVEFEDFGNCLRKIRDDFGVEIDIDLSPLRPHGDGLSSQHVAVGTIRYDSTGTDDDIGILLYFKPTLTGDEPSDIANYRAMNSAFPHETTGDQFYDEAQWESYRRLGEHAAFEALSFLDGQEALPAGEVPRVFVRARDTWYSASVRMRDRLAPFSQRFGELEAALGRPEHTQLFQEAYRELESPPALTAAERREVVRQCLPLLQSMVRLLEELHLAIELARNFNHPQVIPWLNRLQRWMKTPTFQAAWPLLMPLLSPEARTFAVDKLDLPRPDQSASTLQVKQVTLDELDTAARETLAASPRGTTVPREGAESRYYAFTLQVPVAGANEPLAFSVGWARVWVVTERAIAGTEAAGWYDDQFVLYPGFWGAGWGSRLLRLLRDDIASQPQLVPESLICVHLQRGPQRAGAQRDLGHRRERNDLVLFYKRADFSESGTTVNDLIVLSYPVPNRGAA
ncbi:MAG: hypothetical protein U0935_19865 [Pirellulales bacterium]